MVKRSRELYPPLSCYEFSFYRIKSTLLNQIHDSRFDPILAHSCTILAILALESSCLTALFQNNAPSLCVQSSTQYCGQECYTERTHPLTPDIIPRLRLTQIIAKICWSERHSSKPDILATSETTGRKGRSRMACQYLRILESYGTKRISKCALLGSSVCLESYNLMTVR